MIPVSVICITLVFASTGKSLRTEAEVQSASAVEWEYLIVAGGNVNLSASGNDDRLRKAPNGSFSQEFYPLSRNLDKLGREGWELVTVQGSSANPVFYLKRPRQPRQ